MPFLVQSGANALAGSGRKSPAQFSGYAVRPEQNHVYQLGERNEHQQQYEGTFKLRLPDSATPYFFAFGQEKAPEGVPAVTEAS